MNAMYPVYEDGEIAVALWAESEQEAEEHLCRLAVRYMSPQDCRDKDGNQVKTTNHMGGETGWFIIPYTFSVAIAKCLIEQKTAGLKEFNSGGFDKMVKWLIEMEEITDAMCY